MLAKLCGVHQLETSNIWFSLGGLQILGNLESNTAVVGLVLCMQQNLHHSNRKLVSGTSYNEIVLCTKYYYVLNFNDEHLECLWVTCSNDAEDLLVINLTQSISSALYPHFRYVK